MPGRMRSRSVIPKVSKVGTSGGAGAQVECCAAEGWDYAQQYAAAIEADSAASADTAVFTSHDYTEALAAQATTTVSGGAFTATLPARSLVSYVVRATGTTGDTVTVTSPGSQTSTVGASGSATFTWTVSPSCSGGGGGCQVVYTTTDQWTGGFTASVAITNTGFTVNGNSRTT